MQSTSLAHGGLLQLILQFDLVWQKSQLLGNPDLFLALRRRVEESISLSCKLRLRDILFPYLFNK